MKNQNIFEKFWKTVVDFFEPLVWLCSAGLPWLVALVVLVGAVLALGWSAAWVAAQLHGVLT